MQIMASTLLGEAIKKRRKLLKLTQRDLADLSDCAERLVHEVENGKTTLRVDRLLALLRVLGLQLTLGEGKGGLVVSDGE